MAGEPKVFCKLRLEFASAEAAERIHKSVELDNSGYLDSRVDGSGITAEVSADSLNSLLHTLEDFLSCTSIAEKIVSKQVIPGSP